MLHSLKNPVRPRVAIAAMMLASIWTGVASCSPGAALTLGISQHRFTVNGKPLFLLGISYYAGVGAPWAFVQQDLTDMQRYGINWIRVWATWDAFGHDVSAVDREGRAREPFLNALDRLIAECDKRGIVVDVTLSRGALLPTFAAHRRAVVTLASYLARHRNWYMDLANERDIRDDRYVSLDELRELAAAARSANPKLLITASGGFDRTTLETLLLSVRMDFVCPHLPRDPTAPQATEATTRTFQEWMREIGRVVPIHYQEPFRRGYTAWQPTAADYWADLRAAIAGGAAGWCFHNGSQRSAPGERPRRSFDLRERRLFDQLDSEEMKAVAGFRAIVAPRTGAGLHALLGNQDIVRQRVPSFHQDTVWGRNGATVPYGCGFGGSAGPVGHDRGISRNSAADVEIKRYQQIARLAAATGRRAAWGVRTGNPG